MSKKHGVYSCVYSACVCQCVKRENLFFFRLVGVILQGCCVLDGCGLRWAIRAKSSTNLAGRRLGLRFQRGDLEKRDGVKIQSNVYVTSQFRT